MCDCDCVFLNGGGTFLLPIVGSPSDLEVLESILSTDDDLGIEGFVLFRSGFMTIPDVDGIDADEIDGLDTVETFLCNSCLIVSL